MIEVAEHAGFWKRVAATLIDLVIMSILAYALGWMPGTVLITEKMARQMATDRTMREAYTGGLQAIAYLSFIIVSWLYYVVMESSSKQATVGKLALEIKVTDLNGSRIGFGKANARFFAEILSNLTMGIGYLMVAFTRRKQGLHDLVAGTLVVRRA